MSSSSTAGPAARGGSRFKQPEDARGVGRGQRDDPLIADDAGRVRDGRPGRSWQVGRPLERGVGVKCRPGQRDAVRGRSRDVEPEPDDDRLRFLVLASVVVAQNHRDRVGAVGGKEMVERDRFVRVDRHAHGPAAIAVSDEPGPGVRAGVGEADDVGEVFAGTDAHAATEVEHRRDVGDGRDAVEAWRDGPLRVLQVGEDGVVVLRRAGGIVVGVGV